MTYSNMKMALFIGLVTVTTAISTGVKALINNPIGAQTDPQINAEYVNARNSDNVAHEVGDVVVWKDSTYDGIDISTTTTAANPLVAGVVAFADMGVSGAATQYGLIQVYGYNSTVATDTNVAAGDVLITDTTAERCTTLTIAVATTTVTAQTGVFGVALAADSGAVGQVMLRAK